MRTSFEYRIGTSLPSGFEPNNRLSTNKWILTHLITEARVSAVPRDHSGVFVQAVQALLDRALNGRVIAAPQISAPDATLEQGIARDQQLVLGEPEAHRTWRMPRRVQPYAQTPGQPFV